MDEQRIKLLQRRCKRCRRAYVTEVPSVLKGGEFWPSKCPTCGKLDVAYILPASLGSAAQQAESSG